MSRADFSSSAVAEPPELPPLPPVDEGTFDANPDNIHGWNASNLTLPRRHVMLEEDWGLQPGERDELARRIRSGTREERQEAQAKVDFLLEIYIEMMYRARTDRPKVDAYGRMLYRASDGTETTEKFIIRRDPDGLADEITGMNRQLFDRRSEFGMNAMDCRTGEGSPILTPGHHMREVREMWLDLLPRLEFMERNPVFSADNYIDEARIKMAQNAHAEAIKDDSPRRRTMLAWLKPFIARNKPSEWDGVR
jgi:hypothetical protein